MMGCVCGSHCAITCPRCHGLVLLRRDHGAVVQLVAFAFAAVGVDDGDLAGAGYRHQIAVLALHRLDVVHAHGTAMLHLDVVGVGGSGRGAADVEGAHGQLGAGLADGLRRDHAYRLADVHLVAPRQIAAVALHAHAVARLAGDRRAHLDLVHAQVLEAFDPRLVQHGAGRDRVVAVHVAHRLGHDAAEHAGGQGLHHVAALDERRHDEAVGGTAVFFRHHQVLRHIHQAPRQVAGVGRFQRRVGQALAGAVGGDEVLVHRQPFAEVGDDRRFDDAAVRAGHQAAHSGELANLRGRAASAGIGIDVHRVEGLLHLFLAAAIDDFVFGDALHHGFRHQPFGARPDVHDLVVLLAVGDEAGGVLLLDFRHFLLCFADDARLLGRDLEVQDADGGARGRGVAEAQIHELVGEDHRLLQAHVAIAGVDERGNRAPIHAAVHQPEWQRLGHDLVEQHAA